MLCRIADLITALPEMGGYTPLFRTYICEDNASVDIIINPEKYEPARHSAALAYETMAFHESGRQFFVNLLEHDGFYLHSSSVMYDGKGYLFSAPSGTGKSTHTQLWQQIYGEDARVFNDDKTLLRRIDGKWYAYGAPWCGKAFININIKVPVVGICFLKQGPENKIRRLPQAEAISRIVSQTICKFKNVERLDLMLSHVEKIVQEIPVFELENRPEPDAARLSYETMRKAAEEMGL